MPSKPSRVRQARRPSSRQRPQPSAATPSPQVLTPETHVDEDIFFEGLGVYCLPGSRSRHGLRKRWGQIQYAMLAIIAIYHGLPPEHFNASALTEKVRKHLAKNPKYRGAGFRKEMSRQTVLRAVNNCAPITDRRNKFSILDNLDI